MRIPLHGCENNYSKTDCNLLIINHFVLYLTVTPKTSISDCTECGIKPNKNYAVVYFSGLG
jgi:hypothetical protein